MSENDNRNVWLNNLPIINTESKLRYRSRKRCYVKPIDVPLGQDKTGTIILFGKNGTTFENRIIKHDDGSCNVYIGKSNSNMTVYIKETKEKVKMTVAEIEAAFNQYKSEFESELKNQYDEGKNKQPSIFVEDVSTSAFDCWFDF